MGKLLNIFESRCLTKRYKLERICMKQGIHQSLTVWKAEKEYINKCKRIKQHWEYYHRAKEAKEKHLSFKWLVSDTNKVSDCGHR